MRGIYQSHTDNKRDRDECSRKSPMYICIAIFRAYGDENAAARQDRRSDNKETKPRGPYLI
jgi:hypothetical protein